MTDEDLLQRARAPEEDLAFVGEVAEERALGEPGAFGDLGRGRLVVAPLGEELERRLFESSPPVGLPSAHDGYFSDDRD